MADRFHVLRASWREWDGLVGRLPGRTVFHGSGWLKSLEAAYGLKALLIKVVHDGDLVSLWPWLWLRKGPLRILGSPLPGWSTPYLGPLFHPEVNAEEVARAVFRSGELGEWAFSAFRVVDEGRPIDLSSLRFERKRPFETCFVDLTRTEEELWKNLKSACRTRIRKARKSGLEFGVEPDGEFVGEFWEMARGVFAKTGIRPTFSRKFLGTAVKELGARDQLLAVSVRKDGERVACLVLPHDGKTAMYWAGGAKTEHLKIAPNNLLHWEAILACRRRGMSRYDFISTKGGAGRFKKTFGPEVATVFTQWEASRTPIIGFLRRAYEKRARKARRLSHG